MQGDQSYMENKFEIYYHMMLMWVWSELHEKKITDYLISVDVKNVAIYGMTEIGKCLSYELDKAGIKTNYVIDRNKAVICDCQVYRPDGESFPKVDAIIVTPEYAFSEIAENLSNKTDNRIISLQQLLCDATGLVL